MATACVYFWRHPPDHTGKVAMGAANCASETIMAGDHPCQASEEGRRSIRPFFRLSWAQNGKGGAVRRPGYTRHVCIGRDWNSDQSLFGKVTERLCFALHQLIYFGEQHHSFEGPVPALALPPGNLFGNEERVHFLISTDP